MLKKLDIFVLRSFIGPLILTFFIVLIILLLQFLWMYIDELAGKGLNFPIIAELLFQFSLTFVPTALPLAVLLASLMTFGNMGEFSELSALKSSGIPLQRIMRPLIVLITLLVLTSLLFSNYVLPYSNRQARLLLTDIRRKRPDINLLAGSFNNDIDGFSIKVTSKDPFTNRLDKLIVYDHRDKKGNIAVITADSGYIKITPDETALIMTLYNGVSFYELEEENPGTYQKRYPSRKDTFREQTIVQGLTGFELERSSDDLFRSNSWSLNMEQLAHFVDSLGERYASKQLTWVNDFSSNKIFTERYVAIDGSTKRITNPAGRPVKRFDAQKALDSLSIFDKKIVIDRTVAQLKDANLVLIDNIESQKAEKRSANRYMIDWHKKLTLPVACMVFFFFGAPLGAIIRKGGLGTPAVISIFFFVVWYVISLSGEKLVEENLISAISGMWASTYILLPIGFFLTYKASNDSVIMNIDTYISFLRRIKDYIYRIAFIGKMKNSENKTVKDE